MTGIDRDAAMRIGMAVDQLSIPSKARFSLAVPAMFVSPRLSRWLMPDVLQEEIDAV